MSPHTSHSLLQVQHTEQQIAAVRSISNRKIISSQTTWCKFSCLAHWCVSIPEASIHQKSTCGTGQISLIHFKLRLEDIKRRGKNPEQSRSIKLCTAQIMSRMLQGNPFIIMKAVLGQSGEKLRRTACVCVLYLLMT